MMGGIPTQATGQVLTVNEKGERCGCSGAVRGSEIACVSVHGANRLGGSRRWTWWALVAQRSASARVYRRAGRIARCQRV
ncbi:hypothetical protein ACLK1T_03185 [Escherichia coli]